MKKSSIWFKNFAAGRKALFNRILLYGGSALAVHQVAEALLSYPAIYDLMMKNQFCADYVYPTLSSVLFYLVMAVILAVLMQGTFSSYSKKIKDTDISLSIRIGDIFKCDGEIIVPSNNLFTNHTRIINTGSIQHQLAERAASKEFKGSEPLDDQIAAVLGSESFRSTAVPVGRQSLMGKEYDVYPFGTLLPVQLKKGRKTRIFHLVAMSKFVSEGKPTVSHQELCDSINNMWFNIRRDKIVSDTLVIPVMGTGAAKMTAKPMHIVAKYILKTFADNAADLGIKELVLCVYPGDYLNDNLDIEELRSYIDYLCRFPDSEFNVE